MNFYRHIQRGLTIRSEQGNSSASYYRNRQRFNELVSNGEWESQESAELFYYLNRTGFNGLCRFNQQGFFNVPFGKYGSIQYRRDFSDLAEVFRDWKFTSRDFEDLTLREDDLIYADPPYDVKFTQYSKEGFRWEDQVRLAEWLANHPGPVTLSNQATPRIVKLYRSLGYRLKFLMAPRMISCNGDRTPAREVLAYKNL